MRWAAYGMPCDSNHNCVENASSIVLRMLQASFKHCFKHCLAMPNHSHSQNRESHNIFNRWAGHGITSQ